MRDIASAARPATRPARRPPPASPCARQKRRASIRAELGMVAAAALGDVVEERGDIEQPVALEVVHRAAAQRELVGELRHREAAQIAHAPSGCARPRCRRGRGRAASGRRCGRTPAGSGRGCRTGSCGAARARCRAAAAGSARNSGAVRRVARGISRRCGAARATARAASARSCPSSGCSCSSRKLSRIALGCALEQFSSRDVEQLVAHLEALVDGLGRRVGPRRNSRAEVLQQDRVELRDRLGGAVVALHHRFARAPRRACRAAELRGERVLDSRTRCGPRAGRRGSAAGCAGRAAPPRGARAGAPRARSTSSRATRSRQRGRCRSPARSTG